MKLFIAIPIMTAEVLHYAQVLCETLRQDYENYTIKSFQTSAARASEPNSILKDDRNINYWNECLNQIREGTYNFNFNMEIEQGKKYLKLVMVRHTDRSVHCFIDKNSGEVYKAASWKSPAKGVRYNLLNSESRDNCFKNADWAGSYLYLR
jgi:hypothetical protein